MQGSFIKIKPSVAVLIIFLALICLPLKETHAISYSTPGYNVTFYDNTDCDTSNPGTCTILYQLIATIPMDPFTEAGVFTPFVRSGAVWPGADYFSVGFTGYSTPPVVYQGRVAFDDLYFSINGSVNLLSNPGAESGTTGWTTFGSPSPDLFDSVTSAPFQTLGGTVTLYPVSGDRFFLITGTSPSPTPPVVPGFGGFMNSPLISIAGLTGYYTLSGNAAIEAVPEPDTLVLLFTGLVGYFLFLQILKILKRKELLIKVLPYGYNFKKYRIKITRP